MVLASLLFVLQVVVSMRPEMSAKYFLGRGYDFIFGNPALLQPTETAQFAIDDPGWREPVLVPEDIQVIEKFHPMKCAARKVLVKGDEGFRNFLQTHFHPSDTWIPEEFLSGKPRQAINEQAAIDPSAGNETILYLEHKCVYMTNQVNTKALTEEFRRMLCQLPQEYDEETYMDLLRQFGTTVTTGVAMGHMTINRWMVNDEELLEYALIKVPDVVIASGPVQNAISSVTVNLTALNHIQSLDFLPKHYKANHVMISRGREHMPLPVEISLTNLDEIVDEMGDACGKQNVEEDAEEESGDAEEDDATEEDVKKYENKEEEATKANEQDVKDDENLSHVSANVRRAVREYARYRNVTRPAPDPGLIVPLHWPKGNYSLAQTQFGCPDSRWKTGSVKHDYMVEVSETTLMPDLHNTKNYSTHVERFCSINMTEGEPWPKGTYCIYAQNHYGTENGCPGGFKSGLFHWSDIHHMNKFALETAGQIPDIFVDRKMGGARSVSVNYCCRSDVPHSVPMILPHNEPFTLLRHYSKCQKIVGMTIKEIHVRFISTAVYSHGECLRRLGLCFYSSESKDKAAVAYGTEWPDLTYEGKDYVTHFCRYTPNK